VQDVDVSSSGQTSSIRARNSAAVNGCAIQAAAPSRRAITAMADRSESVTRITGGAVNAWIDLEDDKIDLAEFVTEELEGLSGPGCSE
jgi:hypothetical protein